MSMRYAYQRTGGPILDWTRGPPLQSRAADSVALGSLGGSTLDQPTLVLPAPGAPEPVGMAGCSCTGSCGCNGLGGIVDAIPGGYLTLGVAAFVAWRLLRKR
jgi:hypothetical protein